VGWGAVGLEGRPPRQAGHTKQGSLGRPENRQRSGKQAALHAGATTVAGVPARQRGQLPAKRACSTAPGGSSSKSSPRPKSISCSPRPGPAPASPSAGNGGRGDPQAGSLPEAESRMHCRRRLHPPAPPPSSSEMSRLSGLMSVCSTRAASSRAQSQKSPRLELSPGGGEAPKCSSSAAQANQASGTLARLCAGDAWARPSTHPPACRCCRMRSSWAAKCIARGSGGVCSRVAAQRHHRWLMLCNTADKGMAAPASSPRPSGTCSPKPACLARAASRSPPGSWPAAVPQPPSRPPVPAPGKRSQGPAASQRGPAAPPARCSAVPAAARSGRRRGAERRLECAPPGPCRDTCSEGGSAGS
jgi:hypothetical protein